MLETNSDAIKTVVIFLPCRIEISMPCTSASTSIEITISLPLMRKIFSQHLHSRHPPTHHSPNYIKTSTPPNIKEKNSYQAIRYPVTQKHIKHSIEIGTSTRQHPPKT